MKPEESADVQDAATRMRQLAALQDLVASRKAVIDIGTNSVRLLVAEVGRDGMRPMLQALHTPRLGAGVEGTKRLRGDAMLRTAEAVGELIARARAAGADELTIVGTSALRDAVNRRVFLNLLRRKYGPAVVVLEGEEEASLSFTGAVRGLGRGSLADLSPDDDVYVLDVGGGSTELVFGTGNGRMLARASVDVGAVRMYESCITSDPPTEGDWRRLVSAVERGMEPLWAVRAKERSAATPVIAVGGTATSLAAIDAGRPEYDPLSVHGRFVSVAAVEGWLRRMRGSTSAQRRRLPGLQPDRADIILAGTCIVRWVLAKLGAAGYTASETDLLAGVLASPRTGNVHRRNESFDPDAPRRGL